MWQRRVERWCPRMSDHGSRVGAPPSTLVGVASTQHPTDIEGALATHQVIRLLHVVGHRFTGHTIGALWEDTRLGLGNLRSIERIAVVTDLERFRTAVRCGGWSLPAEVRLFSNAERGQAIGWVTEAAGARGVSAETTIGDITK